MSFHRQCEMTRKGRRGSIEMLMSWIPEKFAVVGKVLRLKDHGDGWKVTEVGARDDSDAVHALSREHTKVPTYDPRRKR